MPAWTNYGIKNDDDDDDDDDVQNLEKSIIDPFTKELIKS